MANVAGRVAWGLGLVSAGVAVALSLSEASRWHVPPGRLLIFGFFALAGVNIVVFLFNLVLSLPKWFEAESEDELAEVAGPALQGEPTEIGLRTAQAVSLVVAACLGVMGGAAVALVVKYAF